MSIVSFEFFAWFLLSLLFYFCTPKCYRWFILFGFSLFFLIKSSGFNSIIFYLMSVAATWISTRVIYKNKNKKSRLSTIALVGGISINFFILSLLKYSGFFVSNIEMLYNAFSGRHVTFSVLELSAPLGVSFYTLISIGYLLDVYWDVAGYENNPLKIYLFVGFWPQLTSGPITRWHEIYNEIFENKNFSYDRLCFGIQRMMWGVYKKLVISVKAKTYVDAVMENSNSYKGIYIWIAVFLFNIQLYTDFSGCMDIILGASECYGITLPENFRTPFFSRTVQEFWQRWHITLGSWMKNYVMYPIMKSSWMQRIFEKIKMIFGKKCAKRIVSYISMLFVWLLIGLWHGGEWRYILGMGLWFWGIIVLENISEPFVREIAIKMDIDRANFGYRLFQSIKVFILVAIGNVFFRMDGLSESFNLIKAGFSEFNPWVLFDGSINSIGLVYRDQNILVFSIILLIITGMISERYGGVRIWMRQQFFLFRWIVWVSLLILILIEGQYGPGYDATDFIYRGF